MIGLKVVAVCVHIAMEQGTWAPVSYACFEKSRDCTESLPYFRESLNDDKAECMEIKAWVKPLTGKPE